MTQHDRQRAAGVRTDEADDIGNLDSEVSLLEHLVSLIRVRDDTAQDTKVAVIGDTHCGKVNAGCSESVGHLGQSSRLVLEENGKLLCFHNLYVLDIQEP